MGLLMNSRALKIISSAQITLNNIYDGYTVNLSNDNFDIICNDNGDALAGEIGSNGRAITTATVSKGTTALTAVASNPGLGQFSISISTQVGCTAAKSGNNKVYINTLTTSISGKVTISFNVEGSSTITKDMTFTKKITETSDSIDGKFSFGTSYWATNQNGTGDIGSNVKTVKSNNAIHGINLLEITNETWIYSRRTIDIEKDKVYKCRFRAKQSIDNTTGGKIAYFGYTPFDNAGTVVGTNGAGNMYFKNQALSTTEWTELEYYVSTTAREEVSVTKDGVKKVITPAVQAFPTGAVKFRPMFIVNYKTGNGVALVDGWILEDVTEQFAISSMEYKASQIETTVDGINANVTTIKTYTDMSTNPMTLVAKVNYSAYDTPNDGEIYLHGLNDKRNPADVNGTCIWNGVKTNLPKVMFNPNGKVPDGEIIFMVRNISDNKWWSIWKEVAEDNTVTWKRLLANQASDETIYNHTWSEANDIVVGFYIVKEMTPKGTEQPILLAQIFDGALNYKQATTMSLNGSISQIELLEDQLELKVQKNDVIASINLYTQESTNGTTSGVKIRGDKIDLQGQVTFSSLADSNVAGSIKSIFTQENNKTVINGGMIQTNTIKGNDLNLKGNLTVSKTVDNKVINTFAIKEDGDIEIDGILKSSNFSEADNTGYKISTDGKAILNQALIKGDIELPNAGMTNYGAAIGNNNLLVATDYNSVSISDVTTNYYYNYNNNGHTLSIHKYSGYGSNKDYDKHIKEQYVLRSRVNIADAISKGYSQAVVNPYGYINGAKKDYLELQPNTSYTLSYWIYKGGYAQSYFWTVWAYNDDGSNRVRFKQSATITDYTGAYEYNTFTFTTDSRKNYQIRLYHNINTEKTGSSDLHLYQLKLEVGETATPWCPNADEQINYVRIWAGSSYDLRNNAPFRVYQNGDIIATNGTFSGRILGHIDSGNIHIDNGEFVINSTSTYVNEYNEISTYNLDGVTRDANPNPYIMFSATKNFINTDLIFGTTDNARIKYSNSNSTLDINTKTTINTGTTGITVENGTAWNSGINLFSRLSGNSGSFTLNFRADSGKPEQYNTLYLISRGGKGTSFGDLCLRRETWAEDFDLRIKGNLQITNKITSETNSIEMRAMADGWGFYVI